MFKTILMPSDGSSYALTAAEYAADLAGKYKSRVTVIYVVELPPTVVAYPQADRHEEMQYDFSRHGLDALDATAEVFERADVSVKKDMLYGSAVPTIIRYARDGDFELIAMGARGTGTSAIDQILIGSVAEGILHTAPCPILMVRPITP